MSRSFHHDHDRRPGRPGSAVVVVGGDATTRPAAGQMTKNLVHGAPVVGAGPGGGTPAGVATDARVLLFWLPLGAGGRSVRWNGRLFEALVARRERRARSALYHSALAVHVGAERWVIEMTPAWSGGASERGVVQQGPVGSRPLGRSSLFRYEVRCWRDGVIPDLSEAVGGPRCIGDESSRARRLLALVPQVPALTWGRDELKAGEMWNSNSLTSWLLARSGHDLSKATPPVGGRAPGWRSGLALDADQRRRPRDWP